MGYNSDLIISVDVGTSSLKLAAVDRAMRIVAAVSQSYEISYPHDGWAEQQPEHWWKALGKAIAALKKQIPSLNKRSAVLVFAAQMCGVVAVDGKGVPLRPALIWLDKRAGALMRKELAGFPSLSGYGAAKLLSSIYYTNGAPSFNGMDPIAKMLWLKRFEPETWAKTEKLLDVKDWILHRATGKFVTTADSANLTWMMNTRAGEESWSPVLMKRYGIDRAKLPDIVSGESLVGGLSEQAAAELKLPAGLPVIAGCGDVCAAALGSGAVVDGELHISLGTSAWLGGFFASRRLSVSESYATILSPVNNRPLLIATQETASASLDWLQKIIGLEPVKDPIGALPLFLPWLAGERVPVDDSRLRGAFLGLNLQHDRNSIYASVLEGIALNLRWAHNFVRKQRGVGAQHEIRLVGGGANNVGLCQVLADCLQTNIVVGPAPHLAGVVGSATLAASYLKWNENPWDAAANIVLGERTVYIANPHKAGYYSKRFKIFLDAFKRNAPWFRKNFDEGIFLQ